MRSSIWPTRKNNSVPKNNNSSPAAGVTKGHHRQDEVGRRPLTLTRAAVAEQRVSQFVQRRERLIEHRELVLDGGADLRRAADPFAHRAGERGRDQAQRAKPNSNDDEGGDPGEMPWPLGAP